MFLNLNKFLLMSSFLTLLSSCSTVERINETISEKISILKPAEKETPDVAGKLVCAAAGIETDECVEAVKTENEEINSDEIDLEVLDNSSVVNNQELNQEESVLK